MSLTNTVRTYGHFLEQPDVIRKVGKYALSLGSVGCVGAITAADAYKAQPQDRPAILKRDALVLGSTLLGTALATHKWMPLPTTQEAEGAVKFFIQETKDVLAGVTNAPKSYATLASELDQLAGKTRLKVNDYKNIIHRITEGEHPDAKKHLAAIFEGEKDFPGFTKELWHKLTQHGDPANGIEEGEVRKMANFFTVGGASVLSGLFGGVLANKVNGNHDPDATTNMVKEGVFQFIANIALCAVGASAAILGMSHKPIAERLAKMGGTGKLLKTGGIGAGLSLGIFGGGAIANQLGRKVINPLCDKIQGKAPQPVADDPNQGKRKIEFWDVILHLDDVPTAMALAGLEIVEPFIPLFFGFSGYRTGIGYRNDDSNKSAATQSKTQQAPDSQPFQSPTLTHPNPFQDQTFFSGQTVYNPWATHSLARSQSRH